MRYFVSVAKTPWDVLYGVANLCGMFCMGRQKIAWDVLSGSLAHDINSHFPPKLKEDIAKFINCCS